MDVSTVDLTKEEQDSRGMDRKSVILNDVGLTLKLGSASDKRHTLIVEDEGVSAEQRGTGEDDEVPDERDEDWFQRNLKQLPTIFKWARVHCVTTARLREIESNLCNSWLQLVSSNNSNDGSDPADTEVSVKLLETNEGDFTKVLKVFAKIDRRNECTRIDALSSFQVVIRWLLGQKDNAEEVAQEAHRVLRVYPFSFVARANLFYILWRKGDRTEAVDVLRPLVELRKWRPEIYERILCEGAERAAEDLQGLLQDTCGLKTHMTERDFTDVMRRATLDAMSHSRLLLFILGQKAVSPQMEIYIEEAARRSPVVDMDKEPPPGVQLSPPTHCSCLILTLDSAVPLPPLLQNHHTLPWRPCHDDRMTDSWSDNVCALFHFLVRPAKKRWATNTSDPLLVS